MKYFLAKSEPSVYSIDDLERDKQTVWDGVTNPQAVRAIRGMKTGDRVFIYHSGGVSAIVGLAAVRSDGRDDPKNPEIRDRGPGLPRETRRADDTRRDQAIRQVRRLGAGPAGPALHHGSPREIRRVDA